MRVIKTGALTKERRRFKEENELSMWRMRKMGIFPAYLLLGELVWKHAIASLRIWFHLILILISTEGKPSRYLDNTISVSADGVCNMCLTDTNRPMLHTGHETACYLPINVNQKHTFTFQVYLSSFFTHNHRDCVLRSGTYRAPELKT